jgi:apolipoprotein N-acyltransferase
MNAFLQRHAQFYRYILAIVSGALFSLSLAPYSIWVFGLIALAIFHLILFKQTPAKFFKISFCFALGMFGSGISWVYVSIHDFGFTGVPLAICMTGLFVLFLSLVFSLPYFLYAKHLNTQTSYVFLGLASIWVLGEWLRSWLFSGFPWLYAGYAHIDTALAGYAPIGGVFLISFVVALSASFLAHIVGASIKRNLGSKLNHNLFITTIILLSWLGGAALKQLEWTENIDEDQAVAIIQPNVSLFRKWDPRAHPQILRELRDAAEKHAKVDIQIWPEAAIPSLYHDSDHFLTEVDYQFRDTNIFTGVLYDEQQSFQVYNSVTGLGRADGTYFKQKLVPFGEYVPFEDQLRGLIDFFDLPNSVIRRGPYRPNILQAKSKNNHSFIVVPFICYEVVYPDFVTDNAKQAELMITISNDAWFGDSAGPYQHFEMARMRALENGKYLVRATNTGVSAIIDHRGRIQNIAEQFVRSSVTGTVQLRRGSTPFSHFGSIPTLLLCGLILCLCLINQRQGHR